TRQDTSMYNYFESDLNFLLLLTESLLLFHVQRFAHFVRAERANSDCGDDSCSNEMRSDTSGNHPNRKQTENLKD
uniref:Uncharacterized protein n=1 Tax=Pristionchus pacificus TaxID=54126 RepID=A0A2A6BU20_PRIPA